MVPMKEKNRGFINVCFIILSCFFLFLDSMSKWPPLHCRRGKNLRWGGGGGGVKQVVFSTVNWFILLTDFYVLLHSSSFSKFSILLIILPL